MQLSPRAHLRNARVTIANAVPSLDFCIASAGEPRQLYGDPLAIALGQQADWITGELAHAIDQIRQAHDGAVKSGEGRAVLCLVEYREAAE